MERGNIYAVNNEKGLNCNLTESIYEYAFVNNMTVGKAIKHFESTLGVELQVFGLGKLGGVNG